MSNEIWVEYSRVRQWSASSTHRRRASAIGRLHRASVRRVTRGTSSSYVRRASASGRLHHDDAYRVKLQLYTPRQGQ